MPYNLRVQSVYESLRQLPLTDPINGAIYLILAALAAGTVIWCLLRPPRRRGWKATAAIFVVVVAAAVAAAVAGWFALRHWQVPAYLTALGAIPVAALLAALAVPGRRVLLVIMALVSALATSGMANIEYQTYPFVASLDPRPVAQEMDLGQVAQAQAHGYTGAALVRFDLPGTTSGFAARQAIAYLPPAYFTRPELDLPVLTLIHGNPGGPEQWFGAGEAAQTADAFQDANEGVSPIVVAVDGTGSESGNPICADSPVAKVMTYLADDVPQGLKDTFRVDADQSHWTIGGLSYGGTCSLQVLTNRPDAYGSALDISGEAEPTIGNHQATVDKFFAGDEAAYAAQNPAHLLATQTFPGAQAVFIAGEQDHGSVAALQKLGDAARAAGIKSYIGVRPGGHSFEVWRPALREAFAWVARRGGLEVSDPFDGVEDSDVTK